MKAHKTLSTFTAYVHSLCGSSIGEIVVSPMVWHPGASLGAKEWSFTISIGGWSGHGRQRWVCFRVVDHDFEPPVVLDPDWAALFDTVIKISRQNPRDTVIDTLRQRGATVHDVEDDLEAMRICERLWPGLRASKVRRAIEQERAQWAAEKHTAKAAS